MNIIDLKKNVSALEDMLDRYKVLNEIMDSSSDCFYLEYNGRNSSLPMSGTYAQRMLRVMIDDTEKQIRVLCEDVGVNEGEVLGDKQTSTAVKQ